MGKQQTDGCQIMAEMEDRREDNGQDMCERVTWRQVLGADVSKAYDTVWREGLLEQMRMYGVEKQFIRVCQCLYQDVEASIALEGQQ